MHLENSTESPGNCSRARSSLIYFALGELGKVFVCLLLLVQSRVEQRYCFLHAECRGKTSHRTISRDLIMFHPICSGDQARIAQRRLVRVAHHLLSFFYKTLHRIASLAFGVLLHILEYSLQTLHVPLGLA